MCGKLLVLAEPFEQFFHVVGVLLFLGQDPLHRDAVEYQLRASQKKITAMTPMNAAIAS